MELRIPWVIHGLRWRESYFLVNFLKGAISSSRELILFRKDAHEELVSISGLMMSGQLMDLSSSSNSLLLKRRQFRRETLGIFLGLVSRSPKMSRILNWRKWSDMEVVILPPLEKQLRSFVKMLSIRVAEVLEIRVGCRIRGLNP